MSEWKGLRELAGSVDMAPDASTRIKGRPMTDRDTAQQPDPRLPEMSHHCVDCCCARSWRALGVTEYTGKSIPEHIEELRAAVPERTEAGVWLSEEHASILLDPMAHRIKPDLLGEAREELHKALARLAPGETEEKP